MLAAKGAVPDNGTVKAFQVFLRAIAVFGFLRPHKEDLRYRSAYSRCCMYLRQLYGLRSLPFQSYEAVFLYACAMDAGLFPAEIVESQQCCGLAKPARLLSACDAPIGRFCASVAVILADIKLADDIQDNRSWLNWFYRRLMLNPIGRAYSVLRAIDANATEHISQMLRDHSRIETAGTRVSMEDYCAPTAKAFGYAYGLLGDLYQSAAFRESAIVIGKAIGAALIAFDCAVDWDMDQISGNYNPIGDRCEVKDAFKYSADCLQRAEGICRCAFGESALSSAIMTSVHNRVLELAKNADKTPDVNCIETHVANVQAKCGATARFLQLQMKTRGLQVGNPNVLYSDCSGGSGCQSGCGNCGCGVLCVLMCCGFAMKSACGEKKTEPPPPEQTGCGAQNTRPNGCGGKTYTTKIAGPCDIDNTGAVTTCCKLVTKGCN